jgi:hypothetical protein
LFLWQQPVVQIHVHFPAVLGLPRIINASMYADAGVDPLQVYYGDDASLLAAFHVLLFVPVLAGMGHWWRRVHASISTPRHKGRGKNYSINENEQLIGSEARRVHRPGSQRSAGDAEGAVVSGGCPAAGAPGLVRQESFDEDDDDDGTGMGVAFSRVRVTRSPSMTSATVSILSPAQRSVSPSPPPGLPVLAGSDSSSGLSVVGESALVQLPWSAKLRLVCVQFSHLPALGMVLLWAVLFPSWFGLILLFTSCALLLSPVLYTLKIASTLAALLASLLLVEFVKDMPGVVGTNQNLEQLDFVDASMETDAWHLAAKVRVLLYSGTLIMVA